MKALDRHFARLIEGCAILASLSLLVMLLVICADVLTRNVALSAIFPWVGRGIGWANEVSEMLLYLMTMLAAPWLLRQGQHIRVDILLRALPAKLAWYSEWFSDLMGIACCCAMVWYGARVTFKSMADNAMSIKTLVTPEWWSLAPLPLCFALLAIEFVFRMRRLAQGERVARNDAVSAA